MRNCRLLPFQQMVKIKCTTQRFLMPSLYISFTDRSKAVLLLWFPSVTCCYVCVCVVSSGVVTCITAVHYASCLVLFGNLK